MFRTLFLFTAFSISCGAFASEQLEMPMYRDVNAKIREVAARFGNENVLSVFDIDDTTLVLNSVIGSEMWYEWQTTDAQCESSCLPQMKQPPGANAVFTDINDLLDKLGKILYMAHAHTPEADTAGVINGLQKDGIRAIVLTSRGFLNRDATQRQFAENGIQFSRVGLAEGQEGLEYVPRVTDEEKKNFGITSVRPVNYTRGIINTDGQHKGVMLAAWLREVKAQPKAIVFVDNESKNTNRVFSVFQNSNIDITTIRYSHQDPVRQQFWLSDHVQAIQEWASFKSILDNLFK